MVKKKQQPLTLHQLLGALSFWGTATRTMLFGVLALTTFVISLSEATTTSAADYQGMIFVYVLGSFLLLDFGYVMIARAFKLRSALDMLALAVADVMIALLYIVPKVVVAPQVRLTTDPLIFVLFVALGTLALRMLVGLVFGKKA